MDSIVRTIVLQHHRYNICFLALSSAMTQMRLTAARILSLRNVNRDTLSPHNLPFCDRQGLITYFANEAASDDALESIAKQEAAVIHGAEIIFGCTEIRSEKPRSLAQTLIEYFPDNASVCICVGM
jgi:hypothetical protein